MFSRSCPRISGTVVSSAASILHPITNLKAVRKKEISRERKKGKKYIEKILMGSQFMCWNFILAIGKLAEVPQILALNSKWFISTLGQCTGPDPSIDLQQTCTTEMLNSSCMLCEKADCLDRENWCPATGRCLYWASCIFLFLRQCVFYFEINAWTFEVENRQISA